MPSQLTFEVKLRVDFRELIKKSFSFLLVVKSYSRRSRSFMFWSLNCLIIVWISSNPFFLSSMSSEHMCLMNLQMSFGFGGFSIVNQPRESMSMISFYKFYSSCNDYCLFSWFQIKFETDSMSSFEVELFVSFWSSTRIASSSLLEDLPKAHVLFEDKEFESWDTWPQLWKKSGVASIVFKCFELSISLCRSSFNYFKIFTSFLNYLVSLFRLLISFSYI